MIKKAYHDSFIKTCTEKGLKKEAAETLYKEAARISALRQIWRGLKGLGKNFGDIFMGTGRGVVHGVGNVAEGLEWLNKTKGPRINTRLARSFETGVLSKIPGLRTFGEGFAKSHRRYLAKHNIGGSILAGLGLGNGGIIGNSIAGMGTFSAAHPYLGALAWTVPAALLANKLSENNDEEGAIDTMTPAQRRAFNRIFKADGYSGLGFDADDVSTFGAL